MHPIGVFDSGVGGLSVARHVMAQLPGQPLVYLADQANAPYGQRRLEEIRELAQGITAFLIGQGAALIVVACNTASAAALQWLRGRFPGTPFVGMEPAVKPAAERTRCGRIGVIATPATFQGELFASLLDRFGSDVAVYTQVCPDLVPLVEAGELDSPRALAAVGAYLEPLLAQDIDELVLGCTHYPFLRPLFARVLAGRDVEIIDPSPAVARQAGRLLRRNGWLAEGEQAAEHRFFTTGDPHSFQAALRRLLGLEAEVRRACWAENGLGLCAS